MNGGELLTRGTIWITIAAFAIGFAAFTLSRNRRNWDATARLAWTIACAALLAHVAFAFHFFHSWSHDDAYLETARQTDEVIGLNWGGGLFINYALVTGWVLDTICWWVVGLEGYRARSWPLVAVWRGFLIFIIFNATVVFKTGFLRWAGLFVCLALGLAWLFGARSNLTGQSRDSNPNLSEPVA